jgi:hypothetical protein
MFTSIKGSACQKGVYDKVQKVDYNKVESFSSDACLYGLF